MARKRAAINPDLFAKTETQQAPPQDALPLRRYDSMTVSQQAIKPVKATFYLAPELVARLATARLRLRGMANQEERTGITLSAIVGAALELALRDLEENGPSSRLASMLVSQ